MGVETGVVDIMLATGSCPASVAASVHWIGIGVRAAVSPCCPGKLCLLENSAKRVATEPDRLRRLVRRLTGGRASMEAGVPLQA